MKEHQFQFLLSFSFQNLSELSCWYTIFILNASFELFHNEVVQQSTALESQDVFGWRVSWCCFNSNGDTDLCPEGRAEARLSILSLTTRLHLSNYFHSQFLQAECRTIQFFSHYYSSSPLKDSSSSPPCFYLFLQTRNSSCSTPPSLHHHLLYPAVKSRAKSRLPSTELANPNTTQQSQERLIQRCRLTAKNLKLHTMWVCR